MKISPLFTVLCALGLGACMVPSATTGQGQLPTVTANLPPVPADLGRPSVLDDEDTPATTQPVAAPTKQDPVIGRDDVTIGFKGTKYKGFYL